MSQTPATPTEVVPTLNTLADIAALVGVPTAKLTWWIYALSERKRYTSFEVARRNGSRPRLICAPIKPIKDIQRRLASALASSYLPTVNVHGFTRTRSPLSNAKHHQRKAWVLKVDIEDFFPSIKFGRVRGLFMAYPFGYTAEVATVLAQICCYRQELPQGAPTSPIISNLICRRLDSQLARLARSERCHYTRYADDLCFSTNRTAFPSQLATRAPSSSTTAGHAIVEILRDNGFQLNAAKSHLMPYSQRQRVTGLVVRAYFGRRLGWCVESLV